MQRLQRLDSAVNRADRGAEVLLAVAQVQEARLTRTIHYCVRDPAATRCPRRTSTTMNIPATTRLYLEDGHALAAGARILAVRENGLVLDQTCFYPGGGGQPPDAGSIRLPDASEIEVVSVHADAHGVVWHLTTCALAEGLAGTPVEIAVNRQRRAVLTRYHTVLHVLNTVALRDYDGWITGAQIGLDYSRIDFKLDRLSPQMRSDLEGKVNEVVAAARPVRSSYLQEEEFKRRHDLLRTLEVKPPVHDGRVRIVEIEGFDAQACGGTHVRNTAEIGSFRIERTENKGKINKRLYVRLETPAG
jgi:misacylated tRNA(Ala) deacylase